MFSEAHLISRSVARAKIFIAESRKSLHAFEQMQVKSGDGNNKGLDDDDNDDDQSSGDGLFSFAGGVENDDDNNTLAEKPLGHDLEPEETRNPRAAARVLLDFACRCSISQAGSGLVTDLDAQVASFHPSSSSSNNDEPKQFPSSVKLLNLHMPLGVGASAVVFRALFENRAVAARVQMRHLNDTDDEIFSVAESCSRACAISEAVFADRHPCALQEKNVLRSYGCFFLLPPPSSSSVGGDEDNNGVLSRPPPAVAFFVSFWELAASSSRGTWQAQLNNAAVETALQQQQPQLLLRQCLDVANGVRALHRIGVVHRDLKGINCFVVDRRGEDSLLDSPAAAAGTIVLGDLDSCLVLGGDEDGDDGNQFGKEQSSSSSPAIAATAAGTVWFAAPELIFDPSCSALYKEGSFALAAKVDIWSLGALFLAVLALADAASNSSREEPCIKHFLYQSQQESLAEQQSVVALEIEEKLRSIGKIVVSEQISDAEECDGFSALVGSDFSERAAKLLASPKLAPFRGVTKTLLEGCVRLDPRKRIDIEMLCRVISCDALS